MASPILDVIEVFPGRSASYRLNGARGQTRWYHVLTEHGLVDSSVVLMAGNTPETAGGPRVPKMYEHYQAPDGSFDYSMRVIDLKATPNRAHTLWQVAAEYSTEIPQSGSGAGGWGGEPTGSLAADTLPGIDTPYASPAGAPGGTGGAGNVQQLIPDPLLRPAEVSFYGIKEREVLDRHRAGPNNGQGITNSAGARFDPPLEREQVRLGCTISRNLAQFDSATIDAFVGAVNNATWRGRAQSTVLIDDVQAAQTNDGGKVFWKVTYKLVFNTSGWNPKKVLDRGTYYINPLTNNRQRVHDEKGNPLGSALLNGAGNLLTPTGTPIFRDVYAYDEVDFSAIL